MYISLVQCDKGNIAVDEDDLSRAIRVANTFIDDPSCGKIYSAEIYESEKPICGGSKEIKEQGKLVASLRTMR